MDDSNNGKLKLTQKPTPGLRLKKDGKWIKIYVLFLTEERLLKCYLSKEIVRKIFLLKIRNFLNLTF